MGRAARAIALRLVIAGVLVAAVVAYWGYNVFTRPGPLQAERTVIIPSGTGVEAIARHLAKEGVISDPQIFALGVRLTGQHRRLKAGEYAFAAGLSMRGVADLLESGRTVLRRLTVAEGLTTTEILALVANADGLTGEITNPPGEGTLLPETYFYRYGETRSALVGRMEAALRRTLDELWDSRAEGLSVRTPEQALVLASLIEKETGVAEERARISAVFQNRLRRGMRLQSDPTVVYALTHGAGPLGRALTRADLKIDSPYNTYVVSGLPPTPIANPGRAAIAAALNPARTEELYFVADGNGGHVFAKTLAEHLRNVRNWHRLRDSRNK